MNLHCTLIVFIAWSCLASPSEAQESLPIVKRLHAPLIVRPYQGARLSPLQLTNGDRLHQLIRGGKLYLTVEDVIAVVMENNLDLQIDRIGPLSAEWDLERYKAGGPFRGVTSGNTAVNQVTSGQGVLGSYVATGLAANGNTNNTSNTNAVVSQIGPITPNLDAVLQNSTVFSHLTNLQPNTIVSQSIALIQTHDQVNSFLQQGLLTGGFAQATLNYSYLKENAPSDIINPSVQPVVQLYIRHNFLQGFGPSVNGIYIRSAEKGLVAARETLHSQLLNLVASVLHLYWALVSDDEEAKARGRALDAAQKTLEITTKQIELGSLASFEARRAEAGVTARRQELAISQANVRRQELLLKDVLSRNGLADPLIEPVDIVPLDRIEVPDKDDLPPLRDLVQSAFANRPDVTLAKIGDEQEEILSAGIKNLLLPTLQGIAVTSDTGQAGTPNPRPPRLANPYFIGGTGNAFAQVFRRNFPTNRGAAYFQVPLENRQAQGDYGVDQLQLKQGTLIKQRSMNQIVVDISNQVIALRQARARYTQATTRRALQSELLAKVQQLFNFGSATLGDVLAAESALLDAELTEVSALSAHKHARISLDQVVGETLEKNHISIW
jgi:outer membrane protein